MPCDIIMPVWNQPAFTKDCIDSVIKNTAVPYRLIIIDNGSDDTTKNYLNDIVDTLPVKVMLIRNEENLGFVKAINQGMEISDAQYVCLLNNDTIVTEGWLKIMIEASNSAEDIGIVNPSSNTLGQRPSDGEPLDSYAEKLKASSSLVVELGAAIGFCMLIKHAVIDKIGVFDEIYGMGNFEDTDYSRRAAREGYRSVRACGAYVFHREKTSFSKRKTFEEDFSRNREIYEFRWGRPKRTAYIVDSIDNNVLKRLNAESLKLARLGNWVSYFSKEKLDVPAHSNIYCIRIQPEGFYMKTILKILTKKKKFDEIFVGSERLGRVLSGLSFIHKARVGYY